MRKATNDAIQNANEVLDLEIREANKVHAARIEEAQDRYVEMVSEIIHKEIKDCHVHRKHKPGSRTRKDRRRY